MSTRDGEKSGDGLELRNIRRGTVPPLGGAAVRQREGSQLKLTAPIGCPSIFRTDDQHVRQERTAGTRCVQDAIDPSAWCLMYEVAVGLGPLALIAV